MGAAVAEFDAEFLSFLDGNLPILSLLPIHLLLFPLLPLLFAFFLFAFAAVVFFFFSLFLFHLLHLLVDFSLVVGMFNKDMLLLLQVNLHELFQGEVAASLVCAIGLVVLGLLLLLIPPIPLLLLTLVIVIVEEAEAGECLVAVLDIEQVPDLVVLVVFARVVHGSVLDIDGTELGELLHHL